MLPDKIKRYLFIIFCISFPVWFVYKVWGNEIYDSFVKYRVDNHKAQTFGIFNRTIEMYRKNNYVYFTYIEYTVNGKLYELKIDKIHKSVKNHKFIVFYDTCYPQFAYIYLPDSLKKHQKRFKCNPYLHQDTCED